MTDINKNELPALCAAVGFITINWALMERQMDNIIALSFFRLGEIPGHDKKPCTFKEKAKYLSKVFSHNKEFALHKSIAMSLIERAKKLSNTRHALTHGTLERLEGTVLTINKLQTKSEYRSEVMEIDFIDFPALSIEIGSLVAEWLSLSKTLFDEDHERKQLLSRKD